MIILLIIGLVVSLGGGALLAQFVPSPGFVGEGFVSQMAVYSLGIMIAVMTIAIVVSAFRLGRRAKSDIKLKQLSENFSNMVSKRADDATVLFNIAIEEGRRNNQTIPLLEKINGDLLTKIGENNRTIKEQADQIVALRLWQKEALKSNAEYQKMVVQAMETHNLRSIKNQEAAAEDAKYAWPGSPAAPVSSSMAFGSNPVTATSTENGSTNPLT